MYLKKTSEKYGYNETIYQISNSILTFNFFLSNDEFTLIIIIYEPEAGF